MKLRLPNPKHFSKTILLSWILKPLLRPAYWLLLLLRKFIPGFKRLPNFFQETISILLIFTTIFTSIAGFITFSPFTKEAEAAWFNDDWSYRKPITFTHNANVTNTYIQLDIDTTEAPDKFQADCGDVRFTDFAGNILNYYLDSGAGACDTNSTDFDVLIPSIVNGANIIYMYYGNPSALDGTDTTSLSSQGFSETTPSGGAGSAGTEVKSPTPTLYWKFDDAQGTTAQDSTQNNLDGTVSDSTNWRSEDMCLSSRCLWFDGTNNDNVTKSDDPKLDFAASDNFTVQAWVKRNGVSSANNFILTKAQAGYTGYKLYQDASGDYCFDVRDGTNTDTACTSAVDFDDDGWHLVSGVKAGTSSITLYVDGKQRAQDASISATGTLANTGALYIGVDLDGTSNEWLGFIDDVKVYRDETARTASQVQADYNARGNKEGASVSAGQLNQPGALNNGLVGYWNMDETSGNRSDSSGNGTTLTDTNTVTSTLGKFRNSGLFSAASSEYLTASDNSAVSTGDIDFTLSAWVYLNAGAGAANRTIIDKEQQSLSTGEYRLRYTASGTTFTFDIFDSGANNVGTVSATSTAVATQTWYFVTAWHDANANTVNIQVNNGTIHSSATTGAPTDTGARFGIGAEQWSFSGFWDGSIDDARMYKRVLSATNRSQLYNWGPSPVGHWKMDDKVRGNAQTIIDSSGNRNNGTTSDGANDTGMDCTVTGRFGTGCSVDGTDDNVDAGSGSSLDFTVNEFSISFWLKTTTASVNSYLISKYKSTDAGGYLVYITSGKINLFVETTSASNFAARASSSNINDGRWHHIEAVAKRNSSGNITTSTIQLYVDGVIETAGTTQSAGTVSNVTCAATCNLTFGSSSNSTFFYNGQLDDVRIYDYARTPSQALEDMNSGQPAPNSFGSSSASGLSGSALGYWKFEQGYGTTANNSGNLGSAVAGTLNNMASPATSTSGWTTSGKIGKALSFDGSDDFVSTSRSALVSGLTFSAWIKTSSSDATSAYQGNAAQNIIGDNTDNVVLGFGVHNGKVRYNHFNSTWTAVDGNSTVNNNAWHHIAVTHDASSGVITIYVDGKSDGTGSKTYNSTLAAFNRIGGGYLNGIGTNTGDLFTGQIDEPKIYDFVLTADQIKLDMNQNSAQAWGAISSNSSNEPNSAANEYCIPGDSSTCTAPVGRWDFEEKTGATAFDTSTSENNLTLTNSPTYGNGNGGAVINFAGSDAHLTRADDADFDFSAGGSFTLEAFIKHNTASAAETILVKHNEAGYKLNMESDGDITCGIDYDATYTPTDSVTSILATYDDNKWHHIACVKNANTSLTLYIDGVSVGTPDTSLTNSTLVNSDPLYVGIDSDGTSNDFIGSIDNIRIYNYARSQSQVAWDYNKGKPVAHWRFDECQGTTIRDSSGNATTGTWSGSGGTNTSAGTCSTAGTAWGDGVSGKKNYSLEFDGADDVVTTSDNSNNILDMTSDFSINAWVYLTADNATLKGIVEKRDTSISLEYFLYLDASEVPNFGFYDGVSRQISAINSLPLSSWHHIVGTFDNTNDLFKIYVDGILKNQAAVTQVPLAGTNGFRFGSGYPGNEFLPGKIDDVQIYKYALTDTQVKSLYNNGATSFGPASGAP